MKASNVSEAQIAFVLKQAEGDVSVAEVCRKASIGQAIFVNGPCVRAEQCTVIS